jgi:hypothetical protein
MKSFYQFFWEKFTDIGKLSPEQLRKGQRLDPYDPEERHVQERSFLVVNDRVEGDDGGKLADDLYKLGEVFDQDSVMIIPVGGNNAYLWGTSKREESFPDYNTKHLVGSGKYGKTSGAFLSKIKGREFAFESIKSPQTINGKRGQMILLKEIKKQLDEI